MLTHATSNSLVFRENLIVARCSCNDNETPITETDLMQETTIDVYLQSFVEAVSYGRSEREREL